MDRQKRLIRYLISLGVGLLIVNFLVLNFARWGKDKVTFRSAAAAEYTSEAEPLIPSEVNLSVKTFKLRADEPGSLFRTGRKISLSCIIENTGREKVSGVRLVVRTPHGDITSVQGRSLAPGETIELDGVFTPESSGEERLACRADSENTLQEANENDNKEVEIIYVF